MGSENQIRSERAGLLASHREPMQERRILNSWKEIATYLGRGVRTVQRWEAQLQLPVHRPAGKEHSAVVAFSPELDEWLNSRPLRDVSTNGSHTTEAPVRSSIELPQLESKVDLLMRKVDALSSRVEEISRQLAIVAQRTPQPAEKTKLRMSQRAEAGAA